jgi:septum formation protein
MLQQLQGSEHLVLGGIAIVCQSKGVELVSVSETRVAFRELSDELIRGYVALGESLDKAGAYGIQGSAAQFVRSIEGSYTNVVGLDLQCVIRQLQDVGAVSPAT